MKILLANKFYYRRGGDCVYTINLEQLLKKHGHEVLCLPWTIQRIWIPEWKRYFPKKHEQMDGFYAPFRSCGGQEKIQ